MPGIKVTRDQQMDCYVVTWPDGLVMRINPNELAHGEDIHQVAIMLRERAGL